jgi:hypothetical protein
LLPPGPPDCGGAKSSGALLALELVELKNFKNICGEITGSAAKRDAGELVAATAFGAGASAAGAAAGSVFLGIVAAA